MARRIEGLQLTIFFEGIVRFPLLLHVATACLARLAAYLPIHSARKRP